MAVRVATARRRRQPPYRPAKLADRPLDRAGAQAAFVRNEEIFGEGEPADYIYKVMSGCVRTYNTLYDGRRQIGAFYFPGDIFGLEARKIHFVSAEAVVRSRLQAIKRAEFVASLLGDTAMIGHLLDLTTVELQRAQHHRILLLKTAQERVAGFLLAMADREAAQGTVELPMPRQDIADYLGLTIETVSRTLTRLEIDATISLTSARRVVLRDRTALSRLNA